MKPYINIENFISYLNQNNLKKGRDAIVVNFPNEGRKDCSAYLIIRANYDYQENFTVEFILKFEYKKHKPEMTVIRKEFMIEHHHKDKSTHIKPHVQLHIHGPAKEDKVGQMWITLPLETEEEYLKCIEGFIYLLEEVIRKCEVGLEEELLNVAEVKKLQTSKDVLKLQIQRSLNKEGIVYEDFTGKRIEITPKNIGRILIKDKTLIPLFN